MAAKAPGIIVLHSVFKGTKWQVRERERKRERREE